MYSSAKIKLIGGKLTAKILFLTVERNPQFNMCERTGFNKIRIACIEEITTFWHTSENNTDLLLSFQYCTHLGDRMISDL